MRLELKRMQNMADEKVQLEGRARFAETRIKQKD